ncbi:hypothetical protein [Umezawaea sp. Da 62-37]|uniref:hypothetical protein n=1 Tax=Umezawaea sp. Da 62-37 TaxID=3075927 RepID=UPI0028F72DC1|nr:hypothetical protein [Umezawaea sp. Da 62-37]WNV88338.1 hypothetical protein RM788_08585 [Umezawaea sp. Da 62-37]
MKPDLAALRAAVLEFGGYDRPDRSWTEWTLATAPSVDLSLLAHRRALHRWLNAWGCRIRYPRAGEAEVFDQGVADWWERWRGRLPSVDTWMADLTDEQVEAMGDCFADLVSTPAAQARSVRGLGSTAASKALFALRPNTVMPWDEMIALRLHGARDGAAYAAHLGLGRTWARDLLVESGLDEPALAEDLGRPGRSLAKMIDEYCYLRFTRDGAVTVG